MADQRLMGACPTCGMSEQTRMDAGAFPYMREHLATARARVEALETVVRQMRPTYCRATCPAEGGAPHEAICADASYLLDGGKEGT
jgi:hypothetical protein